MGLTSRVKLSVALDLEFRNKLPIDFPSILKPSTDERKKHCERVYKDLSQLADTFVTTNYDDWLDQARIPFYCVFHAMADTIPC